MTRPTSINAYPSSMFAAIERAVAQGEFLIPCEKPRALALDFQGFRGALRKNGQAAFADSVAFTSTAEGLLIKRRDTTESALAISAALANIPPTELSPIPSTTPADAEAALSRILGGI